jgi:hypothetical protein
MKFARKPKTLMERSRTSCCVAASWSRIGRIRAAALVLFWALPGIVCAAQCVAHDLHHLRDHGDVPFHEQTRSYGDRIAAPAHGDDLNHDLKHNHGHERPTAEFVILKANTSELGTVALLAATVGIDDLRTIRFAHECALQLRSCLGSETGAAPRAPPLC